jgi:hypothetical protein
LRLFQEKSCLTDYIYNEGDNESFFFQEYGGTGVNSNTNYQNKNVGN